MNFNLKCWTQGKILWGVNFISIKIKWWAGMKPQISILKYLHSFFKPTRMSARLPCSGGVGYEPRLLPAGSLGAGCVGTGQALVKQQGHGALQKAKWWDGASTAGGAETQPQLDAFLSLSGHHREAAASRAWETHPVTQKRPWGGPFQFSASPRARKPWEEAALEWQGGRRHSSISPLVKIGCYCGKFSASRWV